jgi:hypothetical protein
MNTSLFHEVYRICTDAHNGAFIPHVAAELLAQRTGLPVATIARELLAPAVYFYDDVLPTLDQVLALDNVVPIIWTEGELATDQGPGYQRRKVEAAALFERYSIWRKRANRLALPPVIGGFTKIDALALLRPVFANHNVTMTTLVDDKPEQLEAAGFLLSTFTDRYQRLFINREDTPVNYASSIVPIRSLAQLPPFLSTQGTQLLLLDLDYTLIDHARTRQEFAERIAQLISRYGV